MVLMVQSEREKYFRLLPNWMNPYKYIDYDEVENGNKTKSIRNCKRNGK